MWQVYRVYEQYQLWMLVDLYSLCC
jgi:hypothetical protein